MRFSIVAGLAALAVAGSAFAQMPPPRHDTWDQAHAEDTADGPGNGLQLELNVFRLSGSYTTDGVFSGGAGVATFATGLISTLQPLALVGYQFDQNAILLGIGIASIGVPAGAGAAGGSATFFGVSPTYRRYLSPLRTGKISTFAEGGVTFSIALPSGGTSTWGIGVDVGGGAEWLFVRNIGLFAKVLLAYGHVNVPSGGGGGGGTSSNSNVDGVGLVGDVGLTVHF